MSRRLTLAAALFMLLVWIAVPARGHHGWTGYNEDKTVTLTGTIRETGYENPHGFIRLQEGENGKTWHVVLAPPSRMQSRGLDKSMLRVGAMATAVGYVHRNVTDELRAERITVAGKTTELR